MKEKFLELCKDPEFVKKLNCLKTEKEVVDFLNQSGIQVRSAAELKAAVEPDAKSLDPEELKNVAGGGLCLYLGVGNDTTACLGKGDSKTEDCGYGYGGMTCNYIGIGVGVVI